MGWTSACKTYFHDNDNVYAFIKHFFVGLMLLFFCLNTYDHIVSYFEGFITQTTYKSKLAKATLPSISICPGFKGGSFPPNVSSIETHTKFSQIYPWNPGEQDINMFCIINCGIIFLKIIRPPRRSGLGGIR